MEPGSPDPEAVTTRPGYLLVVGPDASARARLAAALGGAGFGVMDAAEEAVLAALDLVAPRLLVVDLPEGPERFAMLQRLAAHPPLATTPLVALASETDAVSLTGAVLRGAATCLAKPVDPTALVATAERLVEWSPAPPDGDSRRRRRRPLLLEVEVSERESGRHTEGRLVEASSGGCRLDLPLLLEPGYKVRIVLRAEGRPTRVALVGEVRWAQARDDGRRAAGIEWNASTQLVAAAVLGLVDEAPTSRRSAGHR